MLSLVTMTFSHFLKYHSPFCYRDFAFALPCAWTTLAQVLRMSQLKFHVLENAFPNYMYVCIPLLPIAVTNIFPL